MLTTKKVTTPVFKLVGYEIDGKKQVEINRVCKKLEELTDFLIDEKKTL